MSGAHEFRIHHHVGELMSLLGTPTGEGRPGAEIFTDMLHKNITPYITTQVSAHQAKRKIAESSQTPAEFLQKYDELKSKNVRDLDPLVYLLSKLADDEQTKSHLKRNAESRAEAAGVTLGPPSRVTSQLPPPGTKVTSEELDKIREQLMKEASSASATTSSEILRKVLREKQQKNVNLPVQPEWIFQRPCLTMDFIHEPDPANTNLVPLGNLPVELQENAIIDDLLYCMEGVEGKHIQALPLTDRYAQRDFRVDQSLDLSLRELVKRILPLCSNHSIVVRFIEEKSAFEYGLVNHALSSAMRTLIKDYMVLVAQLEHEFSLDEAVPSTLYVFC